MVLSTETNECLYFSRRPDSCATPKHCQALGPRTSDVTEKYTDFDHTVGRSFGEPNSYWLGLYQGESGHVGAQWVITAAVSFFRLGPLINRMTSGREQCVAHQSWSGKWYDFNCGHHCRSSATSLTSGLPFRREDRSSELCPRTGRFRDKVLGWTDQTTVRFNNCIRVNPSRSDDLLASISELILSASDVG
ncbi:hypothetical protein BV898_16734 [Hypsibius exemplaris]|uniref:C-type lectin domain-containing protein n=1 Tax=Hypsibius exemplaris TaxID=2072580 RepID=A0A9X6NGF6_HYPEX|nr:hypothetical protein BV898_16734 [Hypsibius exemplaris]